MVTNLGNAVAGNAYGDATISLPKPPTVRPAHRPWCAECKRTTDADDLDQNGHCARCAVVIVRRAEAAQRRAVTEIKPRRAANTPPPPQPPRPPRRKAAAKKPTMPVRQVSAKPRRVPTGEKPGPARIVLPAREVVAAYESGKTLVEVAEQFGVSHPVIRRVLVEQGVPRRQGRVNRTAALVDEARRLYLDEQLSVVDIARQLGKSASTVLRLLNDAGVERRPQAPRPGRNAGALSAKARYALLADLGITSAEVRTWARANGVRVSPRGVPSGESVAAYLAAHSGEKAAS